MGYFCETMIRQLRIRNYVLIDQLDLQVDEGLTIITGETGAGKSILLGALGLVLGDRAESGVQADPETKAVLEAVFDIRGYQLEAFFEEKELEYHSELILRREILPQGRSRAFVNDSPASLQVVRELGKRLIDIHQQFDQLDVLEEDFQLDMLDALAGQRPLRADYQAAYQGWRRTRESLARLRSEADQVLQEQDFLRFQLSELDQARLQPGEWPALEAEAHTLRHASEIRQVLGQAVAFLAEQDQSAIQQMRHIQRALLPLQAFMPELEELSRRLDSQLIELQDWTDTAAELAERTEADPARLLAVEERLNLLNRLLQKHRVDDTDTLLALGEQWQSRLDQLDRGSEGAAELEALLAQQESTCRQLADRLTEGRRQAAGPFVAQLQAALADLGMERIRLRLEVQALDPLQPRGQDTLRFEMAQQEGGRFAPVRQSASGGELSRLTLVIKSLIAAAIPLPTLVFDEIDAGVSGAVSMKVGEILTRMAKGHQLLVITHSPQIAARARQHYYVSKMPADGRVTTRVRTLEGEERVRALATMLSTDPPGEAALANARELLAAASDAP